MSNITSTSQPGAVPQGRAAESLEDALGEPLLPGAASGEVVIRLSDPAGMAFLAQAPSGHTLVLDTGSAHGGHGGGVEPLELLLVALAGCTGMDVIAILRKKRQVVTDYRVRVAAIQRQAHPQVYTHIVVQHIVSGPALDLTAVGRAVELSAYKYCPVSAMLMQACPVTHQYRVVKTAIGAAS
ncbi:MAG TPA: OsmC family protein [Chloroflexia bacterium]|nr:OsmC family protein [Chloroflexia bacterium]